MLCQTLACWPHESSNFGTAAVSRFITVLPLPLSLGHLVTARGSSRINSYLQELVSRESSRINSYFLEYTCVVLPRVSGIITVPLAPPESFPPSPFKIHTAPPQEGLLSRTLFAHVSPQLTLPLSPVLLARGTSVIPADPPPCPVLPARGTGIQNEQRSHTFQDRNEHTPGEPIFHRSHILDGSTGAWTLLWHVGFLNTTPPPHPVPVRGTGVSQRPTFQTPPRPKQAHPWSHSFTGHNFGACPSEPKRICDTIAHGSVVDHPDRDRQEENVRRDNLAMIFNATARQRCGPWVSISSSKRTAGALRRSPRRTGPVTTASSPRQEVLQHVCQVGNHPATADHTVGPNHMGRVRRHNHRNCLQSNARTLSPCPPSDTKHTGSDLRTMSIRELVPAQSGGNTRSR